MERAVKLIVAVLPLLFAFAFLAPVIDQGLQVFGVVGPFGLSTMSFGLIVAGVWGTFATLSGRWI